MRRLAVAWLVLVASLAAQSPVGFPSFGGTTPPGTGTPGGSQYDIQCNAGSSLFCGSAGAFGYNSNFPGVYLTITNPQQGNDANDRRAMRLTCSTDSSTSNANFSDENCLEITQTATNGQALNGGGTQAKKTFVPDSVTLTATGSGQRIARTTTVTCYGVSDCAAEQQNVTFSSVPVNGDEAQGINVISYLHQPSALTKTTVTSSTATACNTTVTQNVTKSNIAQTVTVASTTGCNVNDWVVFGQEAPTSAPNETAMKITAVGVGTLTGIIPATYSTAATITPATVLTVASTFAWGQDRVLVDLSQPSYSTGTVGSISGGQFIGSSTVWTAGMVGGSTLISGCISLAGDTNGGSPFTAAAPLVSWYPILVVTDNTHLGVYSTTTAGSGGYASYFGTTGGAYTIRPCAKILRVIDNTHAVLETNSFTWTAADSLEEPIGAWPSVQGFQYQTALYTTGGAHYDWWQVSNTGPTAYDIGLNLTENKPAQVTMQAGGTSYSANDILTLAGGTGGTLKVTSVNGSGVITGFQVQTAGSGYAIASASAVTGGTGNNDATFNVLYAQPGGSINSYSWKVGLDIGKTNFGMIIEETQSGESILTRATPTTTGSQFPCYAFLGGSIPNGGGTGYSGLCANYNSPGHMAFMYGNSSTTIDIPFIFNVSSTMLVTTGNTTGSGTALLSTNSPAVTNTAPYTWIKMVALDGSTVYIPAWK